MSNRTLVEQLEFWRAERPDEWTMDELIRDAKKMEVQIAELEQKLVAALTPPSDDDIEWIVNDMGELGVRVRGRCYFCYKGESLVYKSGHHDDGQPILHRNVGKREFGETVWPMEWINAGRRASRYTLDLVYTPGLSFGPPDNPKYKWLPLPVEEE